MMVLWMAWIQTFFTSLTAGKRGSACRSTTVTRHKGREHRGLMGPPQADMAQGAGAPSLSDLPTCVPVPALPHCLA
jgi:hypothetical protein